MSDKPAAGPTSTPGSEIDPSENERTTPPRPPGSGLTHRQDRNSRRTDGTHLPRDDAHSEKGERHER